MEFNEKTYILSLCHELRAIYPELGAHCECTVPLSAKIFAILPKHFDEMSGGCQNDEDEDEDGFLHLTLDHEMMTNMEYLKIFLHTSKSVRIENFCNRRSEDRPINLAPLSGRNLRKMRLVNLDLELLRNFGKIKPNLAYLKISECRNLTPELFEGGAKSLRILVLERNSLENANFLRGNFQDLLKLDLSYNRLENLDFLRKLTRLTHLFLGYNKVKSISELRFAENLQILHLQHNHLEEIHDLRLLKNLVEIDLSFNMISFAENLAPISLMKNLRTLDLSGNPLCGGKNYRSEASKWLHVRLNADKFELDGKMLKDCEKLVIGFSRIHEMMTLDQEPKIEKTKTHHHGKRSKNAKIREAEIVDRDEIPVKSPIAENASDVHLETKRKIEEIRRIYGRENWLQEEEVGDILGIAPKTTCDEKRTLQLSEEELSRNSSNFKIKEIPELTLIPVAEIPKPETESESEKSEKTPRISTELSNADRQVTAGAGIPELTPVPNSSSPEIVVEKVETFDSLYNDEDNHEIADEEEEEIRFEAKNVRTKLEISVQILSNCIRIGEDKFYLQNLDYVDKLTDSDPLSVNLYFKSPEKCRKLELSRENYLRMSAKLAPYSERSVEMGALQCVKCKTEFGYEKKKKSTTDRFCPNCGSNNMLIELDAVPKPKSESAASSLNEDKFVLNLKQFSTPNKINKRGESDDNGQEIPKSATSSEISVLSDPNSHASSIEVLQEGHTNSQTLMEEPQVKTTALTPTVSDKAKAMIESSSSGSMTESVVVMEEALEINTEDDFRSVIGKDPDSDSSYRTCQSELSLTNCNNNTTNYEDARDPDESTPKVSKFMRLLNNSASASIADGLKLPPKMMNESGVEEIDLALAKPVLEWNYADFTAIDHRLKLFCDLALMDDPEEFLLMTLKCSCHMSNLESGFFSAVIAVTSKFIHVLKVTRPESEDPAEFLAKVDKFSAGNLAGVTKLCGDQGFRMELADSPDFIDVLLRDSSRVELFIDQLVNVLVENVHRRAIIVKKLDEEESEGKLTRALAKSSGFINPQDPKLHIGYLIRKEDKPATCSVIITKANLVICQDYYAWYITNGSNPESPGIGIYTAVNLDKIKHIELYEARGEQVKITSQSGSTIELLMETESSVHELLQRIKKRFPDVEDLLLFNLSSSGVQLQYQKLSMIESMTMGGGGEDSPVKTSSDWIQVIKRKLSV